MVRIRILLRAAACVLGFAIVLSAESATDTDRSLYVKFSEPIIEVPKGEESGGRELIKLKDHNLGKLLLSFNIESIKYAYPLEFRIDSIVHNRYGIPVRRPNFDGIFRITLPDNEARAACLAALDGQDDVLLAEPCISSQTTAMQPNDTCFWKQWGLHNDGSLGGVEDADIDAPEAWDLETGSSNTIIAIIDVGVRTDHEDLAPRAYGDWQTSDHGTHVAGTAAATGNNIAGGAGVNWHAMILDKYHDTTDAGTIAPQIINAVDEGAQILNNSYQTNGNLGSVAAAAAYAVQMDCAFIAGKGNNGSPNAYYPADYYYVFSVGATNSSDRWVSFSNYGNGINVAAPGYNIYGPIATTQTAYAYKHGTSIAGPFVSGIASLLHAHRGDLSSSDMLNLIMSSADDLDESPASPGYDDYTGWGRVNARQALDLLHPPYSLIHYSVSGGSIHQTLENLWLTFMANPYVADGVYIGDRVEIRHNVTFDHEYLEPPLVWGRLAATVGYSAANPNYSIGWVSPVPGSITTQGCQLRTFVYELWNSGFEYVGWVPCQPSQVQLAYTVVGNADPDADGVLDPDDICPYTYNPEQDSAALREWSGVFEETDGFYTVEAVQPMFDGGYLVGGRVETWAPGCYYHLWKVDACGSIVWDRPCCGPFLKSSVANESDSRGPSAPDDRGYWFKHPMIEPTADSGFIVLTNEEGFTLVKLDKYGNQEWYQFPTSGYFGFSVHQTSTGGYVIAMQGDSPIKPSVLWLDANGNFLREMNIGETWYYPDGMDARETSDGGTICVTDWPTGGANGTDIRVVKYDAAYNVEWDHTFGGTDKDVPMTVFEVPGTGYAIAGNVEYPSGSYDQRLMMINSTGTQVLWDNIYGGPNHEMVICATTTNDGGYLLAGNTDDHGAVGYDLYVLKVNENGAQQWSQTYDGLDNEAAGSIVSTDDGGFIVGGMS